MASSSIELNFRYKNYTVVSGLTNNGQGDVIRTIDTGVGTISAAGSSRVLVTVPMMLN